MTHDLDRAYRLLRATVPPPAQPVPKPQDSWQQLKPGQWLANRTALVIGTVVVPTGTRWTITTVNSLGATLNTNGTPTEVKFRLTDTDWKRIFERVRRPATKKTPTRRKPPCSTATSR